MPYNNYSTLHPLHPASLSSVARSAHFPICGENCCCNFSSMWAVNISVCSYPFGWLLWIHAVLLLFFYISASWLSLPLFLLTGGSCARWEGRVTETWTEVLPRIKIRGKLLIKSFQMTVGTQEGGSPEVQVLWQEYRTAQMPLKFLEALEGSTVICERRSLV